MLQVLHAGVVKRRELPLAPPSKMSLPVGRVYSMPAGDCLPLATSVAKGRCRQVEGFH